MSFLGDFFQDFFLSPGNGAPGSGSNYLSTEFTATTSFSVTHNFNAYPIAQIIDNAGLVSNVFDLVNNSLNQVTVTLNVSTTGTLLLVGGIGASSNYLSTPFTSQTSVVVSHGFGRYPVVQVIDSSGNTVTMFTAINDSTDQITVTFPSLMTGTVILQA